MKKHSKSGQAMVEFLVGLVGVLVLILGLSQIGTIVAYDFESILNARMDVAEDLIASSYSSPPDVYDPATSYAELNQNINANADGAYEGFQDDYPQSARTDGFGYLRNGQEPLDTMVGAEKGRSIEIESRLMQKVLGRSSILLKHEVWMPPWDDLQ